MARPSTTDPARHAGQGIASLIYDASRQAYSCFWLIGSAEDRMIAQTLAPDAGAAVEWARSRTPRARIRTPDHRTYWAGTDPAPPGFAGTWHPGPAMTPVGDHPAERPDTPSPVPDTPLVGRH